MGELDYSSEEDGVLEPSLCVDSKAVANFSTEDTPTNGHEYLFSVISEAKKCPKTVVAKLKLSQLNKKQTIYCPDDTLPRIPEHLLSTEQWKAKQLDDFLDLRESISTIQTRLQNTAKISSEFGCESSCGWLKYLYCIDGKARSSPLVSTLCSYDQVSLVNLMSFHVSWLESKELELSVDVCMWLYSLLACLETPLDPDTCDLLRTLSRLLWLKRYHLAQSEESLNKTILTSLNLLICLIALYFGQADLAD